MAGSLAAAGTGKGSAPDGILYRRVVRPLFVPHDLALVEAVMEIIDIRCDDIARRKESAKGPRRLFGGYNSWEKLEEAMKRQKDLPFRGRLRPCLKHDDWWICQASACVKCPDAIWDIKIDGHPLIARQIARNGRMIELACAVTGEILRYDARKGRFEEQ